MGDGLSWPVLDLVAVLGPWAAPWPPMPAAERLLIELMPSKQVTMMVARQDERNLVDTALSAFFLGEGKVIVG